MKKTSGHYPYKQVLYFNGLKIIGKAEKEEKDMLFKLIAKDIEKKQSVLSYDDIFQRLNSANLYFTESLPRISGAAGCQIYKNIFIDKHFFEYLNNVVDLENIRDDESYYTIVHECIHIIQNSFSLNGRNKMIGLIEGATEKEVSEMEDVKLSTSCDGMKFNFNTLAYFVNVAFVKQLEILYGREIIEKFTYKKDYSIIDKLSIDYGSDFTKKFLSLLKKACVPKYDKSEIFETQFELMSSYFLKNLSSIRSINDANQYILKLKNYGNTLIRFQDMSFYREFYQKVFNHLISKFLEVDIADNKYSNPVYNPMDSIENRLDRDDYSDSIGIYNYLFGNADTVNDIKNIFDSYVPEEYKRFRVVDESDVFSVTIFPNNTCFFTGIYGSLDEDSIILSSTGKYDNNTGKYTFFPYSSRAHFKSCIFDFDNMELSFDSENADFKDKKLKLLEIENNYSKRDMYMELRDEIKISYNISSIPQKIRKKISKDDVIFDYYENENIDTNDISKK